MFLSWAARRRSAENPERARIRRARLEVFDEGRGAGEAIVKGWAWRAWERPREGMVRKTWSVAFQPEEIEWPRDWEKIVVGDLGRLKVRRRVSLSG